MKAIKSNDCEFYEYLTSYIYGELSTTDGEKFEGHLADCSLCIDELAAVSLSHYSVFEWKNEEFEPLRTPRIVIPYGERQPGFIESLKGAFLWGWSTPAFVGASVLIVLGLMTLMLVQRSGDRTLTARNSAAPAVISPAVADQRAATETETANAVTDDNSAEIVAAKVVRPRQGSIRPQTAASTGSAPHVSAVKTRSASPARTVPDPQFEADEEDQSLRLRDLFDMEEASL
ncbi:MAG: zf-HC2 domain-containing protein [Acidobacteria bacterium]|nr:zf-HC2 domain-containing protein [Acidobacteriota bacterium]